ncbi:MAG: DUF255 domain-containing protein [Chitinophagales bacterium]|nr:DUF255 domain-containing protein [Chitinophagales bacterium]MCZ2394398.1 DUF255 domain-containing protein [Chitinophagales bacterium]
MKRKHYNWIYAFVILLAVSGITTAFLPAIESVEQNANTINWLSLDEIEKAQKTSPKPVLVSLNTSWCVWCKKMDESTFSDASVINYINKNFYALKFDAEADVNYNLKGTNYSLTTVNNRKVHQLAWEWGNVNGRIGYPTIVILNENLEKLHTSPGFKDVDAMTSLMKYFGEGIYKTKSWQDYLSGGK